MTGGESCKPPFPAFSAASSFVSFAALSSLSPLFPCTDGLPLTSSSDTFKSGDVPKANLAIRTRNKRMKGLPRTSGSIVIDKVVSDRKRYSCQNKGSAKLSALQAQYVQIGARERPTSRLRRRGEL